MSFWEKLKNWRNYLIGWLGGYSTEEVKMLRHICLREVEEKEKQIDKWIGAFDQAVQERNYIMRKRDEAKERNEKLEREFKAQTEWMNGEVESWKETARIFEDRWEKCVDGLRTVQAEIAYPAGMAYDDIKRIARESIVRQLGEGVYEYAKHFLTSDGRYIVAVSVAAEEGHVGQ